MADGRLRPCLGFTDENGEPVACPAVTPNPRCERCRKRTDNKRSARRAPRVTDTPEWRRYSRALIKEWVKRFGYVCPGYGREPHQTRDLTVDKIEPGTTRGGVQVLCRPCNARKGDR